MQPQFAQNGPLCAGVAMAIAAKTAAQTAVRIEDHNLSRRADGRPAVGVIWVANVLAALLFGALHLPAQFAISPLTPLVVLAVLVVNGLGGVFFGWMYARRGLESAMVTHASADIVVHVLLPLATSL